MTVTLKTCPEVLKSLPSRLKGLNGKTIVIDGTLITQRLHFAPMPHPYRHVLGWYRIIKELRDSAVTAICVFDGKDRNLAKQIEIERRRESRRMTTARGLLEVERLTRLCKLTTLVKAWRGLDSHSQHSTATALRSLVDSAGLIATDTPLPAIAGGFVDQNLDESAAPEFVFEEPERDAHLHTYGEIKQDEVLEIVQQAGVPVSAPQDTDVEPISYLPEFSLASASIEDPRTLPPLQSIFKQLSLGDSDDSRAEESCEFIEEPISKSSPISGASTDVTHITAEDIQSELTTLYFEYKASLSQLQSLHSSTISAMQPVSDEDPTEARTEYMMSKTQQHLTIEEGKFWDRLAELCVTESDVSSAIALAERSSLLSESYERRTNPPTTDTYNESLEILRAMGVPCLQCRGPFEAEALASSMVLQGYADYVATEDTVRGFFLYSRIADHL
ncbi:hypothetical protein EW026_g1620 [Hermanssonia centrifuga]|uniref:Exonuclease 1 n=1 Tax=Hermanssonia centrifuga TaxID=98765 RepID=A0A4S4KQT8_9APHY|nr:hypothetical protein EW026_g1620 [Hermanssonia centrifuga]